jgi:N-acetylornithine carbamoyltransferase
MSVPQGLITLMTRYGLDVTLAHPPEYALMKGPMEFAREQARKNGTRFDVVDSMDEAFRNADIVYPKSWGIESLFHNPQEALEISKKYKSWICDDRRMKLANPGAIYMHCLPADRGFEVTDTVIDGPQSRVFPEAENRLHTCKSVMALTM